MKLLLLCLSVTYSVNAFSAAGLMFSCKNFELGEKDQISITVDLEDIACQSTTPFPCWRAEGWLNIKVGEFQDRRLVRYQHDYQRFLVYEIENSEKKMNYVIRSDERLVKTGSGPGTLEIKFATSPFDKILTYSMSCQRRY